MKNVFTLTVISALLFFAACDDSSSASSNDEPLSSGVAQGHSSSSGNKNASNSTPARVMRDAESVYNEAENTLTDLRDNQVYRTVKIGDQVWMAENLNYAYVQPTSQVDSSSFCDDRDGNYACDKYGRMYMWSAAMDSAGVFSTNGKGCGRGKFCTPINPVRGACPKGWHLPMASEFGELASMVYDGIFYKMDTWMVEFSGAHVLKASGEWPEYSAFEASTDPYGFSVLPVEASSAPIPVMLVGGNASFWSSEAGGMSFVYYKDYARVDLGSGIGDGKSSFVRCLMDSEPSASVGSSKLPRVIDENAFVEAYTGPCKTDSTDVCQYGELTDDRDGKTYKTVTIGLMTWMAENLDYESENSHCYNDSLENCEKYGRLYPWAVAMDSASAFSTTGKGCGEGKICKPTYPVRGICPAGWHLPQRADWDMLVYMLPVVGISSYESIAWNLKSSDDWERGVAGRDAFGLRILPAGMNNSGEFVARHGKASFWNSDELSGKLASAVVVNENYRDGFSSQHEFEVTFDEKNLGFSVRCVKDLSEDLVSSIASEAWDWDVSKESLMNSDIDYGSMKDSRDDHVYKTVKIGDQVWMAENLNYDDGAKVGDKKATSKCQSNKAERCDLFGRYYTWEAAQTVCPGGWHLPTKDEWLALEAEVGGGKVAREVLKTASGWGYGCNGSDAYGFSAIPAGISFGEGFDEVGRSAMFWSATHSENGGSAYSAIMSYGPNHPLYINTVVQTYPEDISTRMNVRCVKD